MSWSYSGDPQTSVRDAVRFEISDTNSKRPLFQNEEIEYAIKQEAPAETPSEFEVLAAAARCMEALSRLFAAQADTEVGALRVVYSKHAEVYAERAAELRARAQEDHPPWAGGLSRAERDSKLENEDFLDPSFS